MKVVMLEIVTKLLEMQLADIRTARFSASILGEQHLVNTLLLCEQNLEARMKLITESAEVGTIDFTLKDIA